MQNILYKFTRILELSPQQVLKITHNQLRNKIFELLWRKKIDTPLFYKNITIEVGQTDHLIQDIKASWQLARCSHLGVLGQTYANTHDETHPHTFMLQINHWLAKNPYLIGINWLSPMEVSIRAINWICAWQYFKSSLTITPEFKQQFFCSLQQHMEYLEYNWELYDGRTSNHYFSDLIGYFYLCWFFSDAKDVRKKRDWCYQELLREFDKQIFDEGTSYEGSTAYHRFVTEIFDHFVMLCEKNNVPLSDAFHAKLVRMHEFIEWCKFNNHEMIKVGDDDSGKLTEINERFPFLAPYPSSSRPSRSPQDERKRNFLLKHFPKFGLSIFKNQNWHLSLRHHAFEKNQLSGHIHNDALSITLAVNGIPLVVDPGSFVYTPSKIWRNHFRSVQVHNTFFVEGQEPIPFDERLFALNIPKNNVIISDQENTLYANHHLYGRLGLQAHRKMYVEENNIHITDWWSSEEKNTSNKQSCWNFTLHPEITVKKEDHAWVFYHHEKPLCSMKSELRFSLESAWVSLQYGSKVASHCLWAQSPVVIDSKTVINFTN